MCQRSKTVPLSSFWCLHVNTDVDFLSVANLQPHQLRWFLPLHSGQILKLVLVHVVIGVSHHRLIDALQQPAALIQSNQQVLLHTRTDRKSESMHS